MCGPFGAKVGTTAPREGRCAKKRPLLTLVSRPEDAINFRIVGEPNDHVCRR